MDLPNQIETKRLILRLLDVNDFDFYLDIIKDNDVSNSLELLFRKKTQNSNKSIFQTIIDSFTSKNPIITLIVINKENNNLIGFCRLIPLDNSNDAECFYTLIPKFIFLVRGYM